jgi:hypothetical protein
MSHITKVKTQLKDGEVLRLSLNKAGYRVHSAGSYPVTKMSSSYKDAEFFAERKSLLLGFKRESDLDNASYEILADWQELKSSKQGIVNEITQTYSQEKIIGIARAKGFSVITNRTNTKGQIEMVLRKVA